MSNIQVVVRCRGRNQREIKANSPVVVEVPVETFSLANPTVTVFNSQVSSHVADDYSHIANLKTYCVDQVYGSQADQLVVFRQVALPLFHDFLAGFNTTMLAYGQTGTGKTYTMCGDLAHTVHGTAVSLSEGAGVVPRVLTELFSSLNADDSDYSVRCSFMELYNEEIRDLLTSEPSNAKLRIFDSTQKRALGPSGGIVVQNLAEQVVTSPTQALNLLEQGHKRRTTASTRMNDLSSRSHSIFTIYLYRMDPTKNEMVRLSKMNLVDLAGSENIHKSGAVNQRAKEAGSINQSLLTLGRVINCLSDNPSLISHIPYRESKLTRLLQDSLGGNTKTTLITTVSPAKIDLDETTSTLEYASKAKSIQNKPQSGDSLDYVSKKVLVRDMSVTLRKLQDDLIATRKKNGIWMDESTYNDFVSDTDSLRNQLRESQATIFGLTSKLEKSNKHAENMEKIMVEREAEKKESDKRISEYETKQKNLEADVDSKSSMLATMTQNCAELKENCTRISHFLATTLAENVNSSINSIMEVSSELESNLEIKNMQGIHQNLTVALLTCKKQLHKVTDNINTELKHALDAVPDILKIVTNGIEQQNVLRDNFHSHIRENLTASKTVHDDLQLFLTKDHLQLTEQSVQKSVKDKVIEELKAMQNTIVTDMTSLLQKAFTELRKALPDQLTKETLVTLATEKHQLQDQTSVWSKKYLHLHKSIEGEIKLYDAQNSELMNAIQSQIDAASKTIGETTTQTVAPKIQLLKESINDQNPTSLLDDLASAQEQISARSKQMQHHLVETTKSLQTIKSFDTDSSKTSVLKELTTNTLRSPEKLHGKRSAESVMMSHSRIPALSRSGSDADHLLKKRRTHSSSVPANEA